MIGKLVLYACLSGVLIYLIWIMPFQETGTFKARVVEVVKDGQSDRCIVEVIDGGNTHYRTGDRITYPHSSWWYCDGRVGDILKGKTFLNGEVVNRDRADEYSLMVQTSR